VTPIVYIILGFFTAFVIGIITLPEIIKVIMGREVFDSPGGRKIHVGNIPTMGGAAVFVGFTLSALIWVPSADFGTFKYLFFALVLLAFTGIRDDMVALSSLNKFIIQLLAACVVVGLGGISIGSLYTLGIDIVFPEWLGFAISVFVIVGLTNSFNLVDGIDGLAASIALVCILFLGVWFYMTGFTNIALICASMCGAVLAFICFNWHPAKIFMGDTGSLFIGFFCSVILITFLNKNETLPVNEMYRISNSVSLAMVLFIYPIFDTARIMMIRMSQRRSPFSPDKLHIHSLLLRLGLKHYQIAIFVNIFSIVAIFVCLMLDKYIPDFVFILIGLILCFFISNFITRRVSKFKSTRKNIAIKKRRRD
jgi:UDP-N-acetylmuramyl pentapeptide phosphotransferase/UDP-N-acetylglucosamine-1-phosphate transferase